MQVWSEGRHVGNWDISVPEDVRVYTFMKAEFDNPLFGPLALDPAEPIDPKLDHIQMNIGVRKLCIDDMRLKSSRMSIEEIALMEGADLQTSRIFSESFRNQIAITWRVLEATPQKVEMIFDLDSYEPV